MKGRRSVVFGVLLALLFLATIWVQSGPDVEFFSWLLLDFAWFVLCVGWLVWILLQVRSHEALEPTRGFFVVPVVLGIALLLVFTDTPMKLRFEASKSSMTNAAEHIIEHPETADRRKRIGSYRAQYVDVFRGGIAFTVPDAGFLNSAGYLYSRSEEPPESYSGATLIRLDDHWWAWRMMDD